MKRTKSKLEKEVTQINRQLMRLRLQQQLQNQLEQFKQQLEEEQQQDASTEGVIYYRLVPSRRNTPNAYDPLSIVNLSAKYRTVQITEERAYDANNVPEIGNKVRIINPKVGQPNVERLKGSALMERLKSGTV